MISGKLFLNSTLNRNILRNLTSNTIKRGASRSQNESTEEEKTHFGFQEINASEKVGKVHKVFEDVATNYDIMNDVTSLFIHRIWKDIFMHRLAPTANTTLLDMAGGTGDIAFRFLNYIKNGKCENGCHVVVSDINKNMLDVGRERSKKLNLDQTLISWKEANAEMLPFEDNSFTAYTVAFGIRNMTHIDQVLNEAYRVLQPGGRFLCLEFSQVENPILQWVYDQYSFQVIPVLGQIVAGQWQPYQYLVESIRQFPNQEKFKEMIEEAGFRAVSYENLTNGVVAIHSGFKL
ncbi:2-methoxy-6-polyprenyl-1,4-benzoquinol methylase, mitochondrial [Coccinella septempunctata]|uniref:2-methoxy-6-polyprenyl-1,4-benzoquinol methylase, mitochondrial n=1 Tax=Coccinella septempunctata TaxID=41139 RepID=UPI001D092128|nr:2-methoxy-6-polyprenyl-1,4-benzoquinol methylase, mitochondrial [Coccinella septempunctata]